MTKAFFIASLLLLLVSCNESKKEPEKTDYEIRWAKQEKLDTLNQNEAIALSKKFDAITNKDSTIKFTFQIQKAVKINRAISFIGNISDMLQQDSNYLLRVYGTFSKRKCFAEILISPQQFYELNNQLDERSSRSKGCFIFKPTRIKSSSLLTIDSEVLTDEGAETVEAANANASSELTYDYHDVLLFFKGNLIDFYMYKKLPKDGQ